MKILLKANPEAITIDTERTVVIVVDLQNDFVSEGGMFHSAGIDVSEIRQAVARTASVLRLARGVGVSIIYLKMALQQDLSDLGPTNSPTRIKWKPFRVGDKQLAPDGSESRILIRDTWNTDIVDEVQPEPNDHVIYKHRYSGFYETDLDTILKRAETQYIVFTGGTTSVCVESTLRDAMYRDYHCILLSDCVAEPLGREFPRTNHESSLLLVQSLFGWVSDSDEFERAIKLALP